MRIALVLGFIILKSVCCFAQQADFFVAKSTHKFPKTVEGPTLTHEFIIENKGEVPLIISDYKVACPCTKVELPAPIPPGKTGIITVTFDTKGKYYQQDRAILLQTNDKNPTQKLRIKVFVIPKEEEN